MQTSSAASQEPTMNQIMSQPDEHLVDEHFKLAVKLCLERFASSDEREVEFPSCFSGTERTYIHRMAQSLGYVSKSKEKGPKRFLVVWKNESGDKTSTPLSISHKSLQFIQSLLQRFPTRYKEDMDIQFNTESGTYVPVQTDNSRDKFRPTGFLHSSLPLVPNKRNPSELDSFRCSLPVHGYQEEIVQLIRTNRVLMVVGETGSGKTTQIPQFLLDDCHMRREACRMFCTQPRRLAVISLAERVAAERGESVGQTVGYHIRLENRISPKTLLTFCTHGVLLRTLMTGDSSLKTVTHVVMDDVDERDGLTDVLLTKMWSILEQIPTLKLILSSAALNVDLFHQYFDSCPVIHIKERQFEVQELFLEDVLKLTGFNIQDARKHEDETSRKEKQQTCLTKWCKAAENDGHGGKQRSLESVPDFLQGGRLLDREDSTVTRQAENNSEQLEQEMDLCISNSFFSEDLDSFNRLFDLILYKNVHVDYAHSEMGATPLMVAASRGLVMQMEQLLIMGADITIKATNGWTALDFARSCQHPDAVDLLQASFPLRELSGLEDQCGRSELSSEEQELDLIMDLLHYICSTTCDGSVLIFVADYSHIVSLKYRIQREDQRFVAISERFQMFSVYSDTQTLDHKTVMDASPPGVRKIILSTNIAETSITISDVVFVIDSGKIKETSFDSISHVSMLKTVWISKASALQRKGRAGRCRPGICFHLFSRHRLNNMVDFKVPQLLQMPLQGLCLQTKLLVPSCPVSDFLSKTPQPPPADAVSKTVHRLKAIDAMDQDEDLTYLGCYLADISIEPHLGKMVLSSVALKCLDPVLTIACALAYRDPFVLPKQGREKNAALQCRRRFSSCSLSDHMALLRAFQAWQRARREGGEKSFCEKNFLSQSTMEMIFDLRVQLLGQLRAIGFVRPRGSSNIHELNQNSENWAVVKAALVAGMYPNMVHMDWDTSASSSSTDRKVHFHPTSVLNQFREINSAKSGEVFPTTWLIYDEMCRGKRKATVRCCSLVTPITVAIFAGRAMLPSSPLLEYAVPRPAGSSRSDSRHDDSDSDTEEMAEMSVDKWLTFHCDPEAAGLVFKLKQMWQSLFVKRVRWPSKVYTQREETILQILVSVLTEEERGGGLQQPTGIGQRPWPMTLGDLSLTPVNTPDSSSSSAPDRSPAASGLVQRRILGRDDASLPTRRLSDDLWTSCSLTSRSPSTSEKVLTEDEQRQPSSEISPWTL
ncbi:3-5 RNA helicase YTHDC2 isoform X1 [Solea senegalensis]|uniref:RNA helicase n=1 Tax=Solea senegalensis TaxID=28829 RepID=A0AAV6QZ81_SOLSE|nr:3'-5' RNA helicase YTHDC2 isoform X1 [Solea senegalensis]KAG7498428.1 3-5 RNA helicase YTHDC2 isoform X1 [Solea senegalensis]